MSVSVSAIRADVKKIAADVASVGASLTAVLAIVEQAAPNLHVPAGVGAALVSVTAVVSTIVLEARRLAGASAKPAA